MWVWIFIPVFVVCEVLKYRQYRRAARKHWELGVLQGYGATRWPSHPQYRDARKVIDDVEAQFISEFYSDPKHCQE